MATERFCEDCLWARAFKEGEVNKYFRERNVWCKSLYESVEKATFECRARKGYRRLLELLGEQHMQTKLRAGIQELRDRLHAPAADSRVRRINLIDLFKSQDSIVIRFMAAGGVVVLVGDDGIESEQIDIQFPELVMDALIALNFPASNTYRITRSGEGIRRRYQVSIMPHAG